MKYDVFISCKSEDYIYAEEIYNHLKDNGIDAFLASKELRRLGDSEYRNAIADALDSSYNMILFASNADYIKSKWVYYEWDMFVNAMLDGSKSGQIITVLKDIKVKDIRLDLRKYQSFDWNNYKDNIIPYVDTVDSKERRTEHKKHKEQEESLKQEQIRNELKQFAEEYRKKAFTLQTDDALKIYSSLKRLGISEKGCQICGVKNDINNKYCTHCGWPFSPIDNIPGAEYLSDANKQQRDIYKRIYAESQDPSKVIITKGMTSEEVALKKWNWGAFTFNWIWGISNGIYWPLIAIPTIFIPIIPICISAYLGVYGNRLAWDKQKGEKNITKFIAKQRKWNIAALWLLIAYLIIQLICIIVLLAE